jgi:hypothetical protein
LGDMNKGDIRPKVSISDSDWEIVDDAVFFSGWVGLSHGDIYLDDQPFGHYVAAWYPNTTKDVQVLITALNEARQAVLCAAFVCPVGSLEGLHPVGADSVPWSPAAEIVSPKDYPTYSLAETIAEIAPEVIQQDLALHKCVVDPTSRLTDDRQMNPWSEHEGE